MAHPLESQSVAYTDDLIAADIEFPPFFDYEEPDFQSNLPHIPNILPSENSTESTASRGRAVQIEEIEDEDANSCDLGMTWTEEHEGSNAGETFGEYVSSFKQTRRQQEEHNYLLGRHLRAKKNGM